MTEQFDESWNHPSYLSLIIILSWVIGASVLIWQWHVYSRAADRQAVTTGLVTAVERGNRVSYQFTYANHVYTAIETPLYNRRVPLPGEKIPIYYDSEMPTVSGITDLHQRSIDALGPVPFTVMLSGIAIFVILRRIHAARNS
ncbi:MAG TPA: hypothetical protein VKU42_09790 [Candidatus Angelobacter sp.]|nr:hypothetical protein [Candidatus Angelobacter sp.]